MVCVSSGYFSTPPGSCADRHAGIALGGIGRGAGGGEGASGKIPEHFLRIERDPAGRELGLQTAIVRFESDLPERRGCVVDLIGAVHIGEKGYYKALNKQFEDYDAVLYELWRRGNAACPRGPSRGPPGLHFYKTA